MKRSVNLDLQLEIEFNSRYPSLDMDKMDAVLCMKHLQWLLAATQIAIPILLALDAMGAVAGLVLTRVGLPGMDQAVLVPAHNDGSHL